MKIIKYTFLLFMSLSFHACSDFLDIQPESDVNSKSFWKTSVDANSGIISIYNSFSKALSTRLWDWGEFKGDEFVFFNPTSIPDQLAIAANVVRNDNTACKWDDLYQTIGRANAAIKYIPDITMSVLEKNRLLASAYTMRAWSYFYVVRVWGDAPLTLTPFETISNDVYLRKTKKESIHKVIVSDLQKADSLMGISTFSDKRYVTRGLIYVLQMDVYAWLHQYDLVEQVMLTKVTPLVTSASTVWGLGFTAAPAATVTQTAAAVFSSAYRSIFLEDPTAGTTLPKENIFRMIYSRTENGNNAYKTYFSIASNNAALYSSSFVWDPKDLRATTINVAIAPNPSRFMKKYPADGEAITVMDNDLVFYRYADVVLLYAEALCMQGKLPQALDELNRTRVRAGLTKYTVVPDQNTLLDNILLERKFEFVGEGKRWFDLVRTNKYERKGDSTDDINSTFFPIYRDNLLTNPNLSLPAID